MKIVSTFAPPTVEAESGQRVALAVFDTFVDGKDLVVGLAVGRVGGRAPEDTVLSTVGAQVLHRLAEYRDFRNPDGAFIVAGVEAQTAQRVRKVLQQAPSGSALLLVCTNDNIYDAAFEALHVDLQPFHGKPQ